MALPATRAAPMTIHDLEALPETDDRLELLDGELIEMPPPKRRHFRLNGHVTYRLSDWVFPRDIGIVGHNGGVLIIGGVGTVLEPDIAFISNERLPEDFDWDADEYLTVVPDLVIEILSPSDRASATQVKIDRYLSAGVRLLWLIDPERRSVAVWTADRRMILLTGNAVLDGGEVLPGFTLPLGELFG